jgi:hypothetical protein
MTPKEKAGELVNKFLQYTPVEFEYEYAKQCALIAVDEIIKSLRKTLPEIGLGKGYWYSVRKEIENL